MPHLVLLGDSILDNAAYTRGEPDVLSHVRRLLPHPWRATLLAVDGSTTRDIAAQISRMPADATHAAVAIGGNDALMNQDLLATPVHSTAEALALFADRLLRFEADYRAAIDAVLSRSVATTVCTIYNGNLEPPRAGLARVALTMFNDVILRTAFARHLGVIELRLVCTTPEDYANPIEPSGRGGAKIAHAIARAAGAVEAPASRVHW